jgi:hypothetical protein
MIIPTKGIRPERSLLYIGGQILASLDEPTTVSVAWESLSQERRRHGQDAVLAFDWFILALDLLFALSTIELRDGLITKIAQS